MQSLPSVAQHLHSILLVPAVVAEAPMDAHQRFLQKDSQEQPEKRTRQQGPRICGAEEQEQLGPQG